jgi:hypothetical protein
LPGEQWGDNAVFDTNITPNQKYTVKVTGTTSDGSSFSMAKTISAMG